MIYIIERLFLFYLGWHFVLIYYLFTFPKSDFEIKFYSPMEQKITPVKEEKKSNAGRKPRYEDIDLNEIIGLFAEGQTNEQVGKNIGVSHTTWAIWKNEHPELVEAIKRGQKLAIQKVENALFLRATGQVEIAEDKIFQYEGSPVVVPTVKRFPPDPVSMIFFLKNRNPEEWKDKQEVELTKPIEVIISDYRGSDKT